MSRLRMIYCVDADGNPKAFMWLAGLGAALEDDLALLRRKGYTPQFAVKQKEPA